MYISNKQKWIIFAIVGIAMLSISFWSHQRERETMYELSGKEKELDVELNIVEEKDNNPEEPIIMVYVVGEVVAPGVYELKEGARVLDVIEAAGGFTEEADREQINLAMKIYDEDDIRIPAKGEVNSILPVNNSNVAPKSTTRNTGKININNASEGELTQLTGIGSALAERIVNYRQQNGPFKSIEELKKVSGIGDKKFEQLKENIIVR